MEQAATAPWVTFKKVSVEDRDASIKAGSYIAKDVDFAFITPAGSKDCVEKPVKDWFESLEIQVENNRFPGEWLRHFKAIYAAWQKDEEIPVEGTSIKNWAVASPAQIEMMLKLHIRTVEQLAAANEEVIGRLGMGGRALVEKAKGYAQQQTSGVGKLVEENADLKGKLETSQNLQLELQEQMKLLQAQVEALKGASNGAAIAATAQENTPTAKTGEVGLSDLLDDTSKQPAPATRKL